MMDVDLLGLMVGMVYRLEQLVEVVEGRRMVEVGQAANGRADDDGNGVVELVGNQKALIESIAVAEVVLAVAYEMQVKIQAVELLPISGIALTPVAAGSSEAVAELQLLAE